jgi:hypothetical protein
MERFPSTQETDGMILPAKFVEDGFSADLEKWLEEDKGMPGIEIRREIKSQAIRKLELLDDIYRDLVKQARNVLEKARDDLRLHQVPVNASKIRGRIYYLYSHEKAARTLFFSILNPSEYSQADHSAHFIHAYRLNEDNSWSLVVD